MVAVVRYGPARSTAATLSNIATITITARGSLIAVPTYNVAGTATAPITNQEGYIRFNAPIGAYDLHFTYSDGKPERVEKVNVVALAEDSLASKQDAATAATDEELAAAVSGAPGRLLAYKSLADASNGASVTQNNTWKRIRPNDLTASLTFVGPASGVVLLEAAFTYFWDNDVADLDLAFAGPFAGAPTRLIEADVLSETRVEIPRSTTISRYLHVKRASSCTPGTSYTIHFATKGASGALQVNGSSIAPCFLAAYTG